MEESVFEQGAASTTAVKRERRQKWLRRAGWIALGAAGSFTLALGVASYPLSGLLVRPRLKRMRHLNRPHFRNFIRRLGIKFEDVTFPSFDGTCLHGWWVPVGRFAATVIVLHGVKKNRTDVVRAAIVLRQAGFNVLLLDGRGHGLSDPRYVTYGFNERRDVESAIEWLAREKRIDTKRIGLAGESMGAAIALQVAAHNPAIGAVWADSPFASLERITREYVCRVTGLPESLLSPVLWTTLRVANYRGRFDIRSVDPLVMAKEIKCPTYLVHGTADQLIPTAHSENIYEALQCKKEIWMVEGARHAKGIRRAKREYAERMVRFFKQSLRRQYF